MSDQLIPWGNMPFTSIHISHILSLYSHKLSQTHWYFTSIPPSRPGPAPGHSRTQPVNSPAALVPASETKPQPTMGKGWKTWAQVQSGGKWWKTMVYKLIIVSSCSSLMPPVRLTTVACQVSFSTSDAFRTNAHFKVGGKTTAEPSMVKSSDFVCDCNLCL